MNTVTPDDHSVLQRYVLSVDGINLGFIEYYLYSHVAIVTYTQVEVGHEGKGIGSELARQALAYFRAENKQVVPVCGFFASYLRQHPEFSDLTTVLCKRIFSL